VQFSDGAVNTGQRFVGIRTVKSSLIHYPSEGDFSAGYRGAVDFLKLLADGSYSLGLVQAAVSSHQLIPGINADQSKMLSIGNSCHSLNIRYESMDMGTLRIEFLTLIDTMNDSDVEAYADFINRIVFEIFSIVKLNHLTEPITEIIIFLSIIKDPSNRFKLARNTICISADSWSDLQDRLRKKMLQMNIQLSV